MINSSILTLTNLHHSFPEGKGVLHVLQGVSLSIEPGEIVALVGPSGAGKSTLLQTSGLLEKPTRGSIKILNQETGKLSDKKRTEMRRNTIGFVYQFHHLLPEFTALENVMLPQLIENKAHKGAEERAKDLIQKVGLENRMNHRPKELSGGEQQRIAIARALANSPKLLLADEPTGNLDTKTAEMVFQELVTLVKEEQIGALIATHNPDLANKMDRTLTLVDGKILSSK